MISKKMLAIVILGLMVSLATVGKAEPMGTAWTYQGRLIDANGPGNGVYDIRFYLYDAAIQGTRIGPQTNMFALDVIDGYFTAELDFGAGAFSNQARWLEIAVNPEDPDPNYITLTPRQKITPAPYTVDTIDRIQQLESRIAQLEALLAGITRDNTTLQFSGFNVQIVNGTGSTETANNLGNLIVGYNELRGSEDDRSGSHNIIVGKEHNYSSYGGLIAAKRNAIMSEYSCVSGGSGNTAAGECTSVSGGFVNTANGEYCSVSGGISNEANGAISSISGGRLNVTKGEYSSISGGWNNIASGARASISGGRENDANGLCASISGGYLRSVIGDYDWRAGGLFEDQ